jgi:peptidoglycan/xylan/chitin deacetylase (PgdA/CDA1 family)
VLIGLCYHGVNRSDATPFNSSGKHLPIADFRRQMGVLRRKHRVLSVDELYEVVRLRQFIDKDYVFITFDDGYLNNFTNASEILGAFQLPATLFLATDYIGNSAHIWTDALEDFFMLADLDQILVFAKEATPTLNFENTNRHMRYNWTRKHLKTLSVAERDGLLDLLPKKLITKEYICTEFHAFLDWESLSQMKSSGLWTFGSHTATHNPLTKLEDSKVRQEVTSSFEVLEKRNLINGNRYFAYPEGQPEDLSGRTRELLLQQNVSLAFSAHRNQKKSKEVDPLALERVLVGFEEIKFPL